MTRTGTVHEEIELRAGVEPIDDLLAQRHALVEQSAELWARFGPFGTWDHERKAELARLKALVRLQADRDKRKLNNDQVDDESRAHPDYTVFVVEGTKGRAEFFRLNSRIEAIDYRINRGQALVRYVSNEPRQ